MPKILDLKNFYHAKPVLVTGGAGFIGTHLVNRLVELGAKVTVLDNLSTGNLQNLTSQLTKIKLIIGNIISPKDCVTACTGQEIIFHTAAMTAVNICQNNPTDCWENNVTGTKNLLENCPTGSTFVLSSSAAVYGDCTTACLENQPAKPLSIYGKSKLAAEQLCQEFALKSNLNCLALRYFNVYGPGQELCPNKSVVTIFKQQILAQQPITIFGDGSQLRDFVSTAKVIEANVRLAANIGQPFNIFNVATGHSISLTTLLEKISQQTRLPVPPIKFKPAGLAEINISKADVTKYKQFMEKIHFIGDVNESIKPNFDLSSNNHGNCTAE